MELWCDQIDSSASLKLSVTATGSVKVDPSCAKQQDQSSRIHGSASLSSSMRSGAEASESRSIRNVSPEQHCLASSL
jgi:hypothetical protein